ncbi:unnamed protein product [Ceutorhynchus assimilis]|uniref:Uncharacterized protein n=1 Tax=Ceutorhynchus assimilis TaxID=467358 RepID=A0A9N9MEB3_9CUCU|nr:unnamed protein product [Ceutorhynchus assimilis]
MNFLIIFVCVFVYTNASISQGLLDQAKSKIQEYGLQCVETEKPTDADIEAFMNKQPPKTHAGKCVMRCVFEKFDIMHPDGTYGEGNVEWLNKVKAEDEDIYNKIQEAYEVCQEQVKTEDLCERAFDLVECGKEESKKRELDEYF